MGEGNDATQTPGPAFEPEGDVTEDNQQGQEHGDDGIAFHVVCNGRTHLVRGNDTVRVVQGGTELVQGDTLGEEALDGVVEFALDFGIHIGRFLIVLVLGGNLHLALATELLHLHGTVELDDGSFADGFGGNRLVKTDHVGTASREIDTVGKALGEDGNEGDQDQGARKNVGNLLLADEVDIGVLQEVLGSGTLEGDVLASCHAGLEDKAGDEDGRNHGGDDTDDEGGGKALDRTGTEHEENDTGKEGGHLAVEDGGESVAVTVGDGLSKTLARSKLFLHAFINNNVRIHSHTHGQNQTGDTRQGKDGTERYEGTEEEEDVAQQGDVGRDAGTPVEEHHVDEHQDEGDDERNHTAANGFCTEGRTYDLLLDDGGRGGELTGLQHVGEVLAVFHGEVAGNLGVAAGDFALDRRIRIDHAVQHDGNLAFEVVLGQAGPGVGTFGVHGHGNVRGTVALGTVGVHAGVGHGAAVQRSQAVTGGGLDGDQFVQVAVLDIIRRLHGPHRDEFSREDFGNLRHAQVLVHLGGIYAGGETDAGVAVPTRRLQDGEQRILLAVGFHFGGVLLVEFRGQEGIGSGRGGGSFDGFLRLIGEDFGELGVGFGEVLLQFLILEGGPELEGSRSLEEFADTLRLFHTRKFHEDAAAVAQFLDRRLGDTEAVDTVAEDVEGVGNGAFGLAADDIDNLIVGGFRFDFVAHFIRAEHLGEALAAADFLPSLCEQADVVLAGRDAALGGQVEGLEESRGGIAARDGLHKVLELHLQHHVHTAFEVQTEVDFLGFDILEGVAEVNFLVGNGINVNTVLLLADGIQVVSLLRFGNLAECSTALGREGSLLCVVGGFLLLKGRYGRERKLPEAGDGQQNRYKFDSTFALHFVIFLNYFNSFTLPMRAK